MCHDARGITSRVRARGLRVAALSAALAFPGLAPANPQGAQVVHGNVSFAMPDASTLNVTNTPGAIINWQQFGISPGEVTRFLQQGAASAVLNRVVGGDPSAILGSLLSNGQVFLINPNGVVFGAGAVVDTAGLLVSTLDIADEDFLAGRLDFSAGEGAGAIENRGRIHAAGSVVLIAPRIENSGLIETEGGGLLLAAGSQVEITSLENPEVSYQLRAPEHEAVNIGELVARGGAASIFAGSIRHSGEVDASGVTVDAGGRVRLVASAGVTLEAGSRLRADGASGGSVEVDAGAGRLSADSATVSAIGRDGAGGRVALLGEEVVLEGTTSVDASGAAGGGELLVGGDYQGANPAVANARNTGVGRDAVLRADAGAGGDGGKLIVWADEIAIFRGDASARGGVGGGDGGFIEVSGRQRLQFLGSADAGAPAGASGTVLLDPDQIVIVPGTGADDAQVADGQILFVDGGTATFQIGAATLAALNGNIVLEANVSISTGNLSLPNITAGESVTLSAGNNISSNGIATGGGDLIINTTTSGFSNGGPLSTNGGSITLNSFYDFFAGLDSGGGNIVINGDGRARVAMTIDTGGGDLSFNGFVSNNGQAANTLTLDLGTTGDLFQSALRNNPGTLFAFLQPVTTVVSARDVSLNGRLQATSFTQSAGTGTTTFNDVVSSAAVNLTGNDFVFNTPLNSGTAFTQGPSTGTTTFNAAVNADTLALTGNDFVFNAPVTATTVTTGTGPENIAFLAGGSVNNAATFGNSGTVTFGDGAGDVLSFGNGVTANAPNTISVGGTLASTAGNIDLGGNTVTVQPGAQVQAAGDVTINPAATALVSGAVSGVNATLNSALLSLIGSVTASGTATLSANTGALTVNGAVNATGAASLSAINANVAMGASSSVTGSAVSVNAATGAALGRLDAGGGNVSVTVSAGSISDANGGAVNVAGAGASLNGNSGIGSAGDPLETQLAALNATSNGGAINVLNTGDLFLSTADASGGRGLAADVSVTATGVLGIGSIVDAQTANVVLVGETGLGASGSDIRGGNVTLGGGSGTALLDFSSVAAGGLLTVTGNDIDLYSSNVNATDVSLVSTTVTHVTAGEGTPSFVGASNRLEVLAGELLVEGGSVPGDTAKLQAGNSVVINAGNVTVKGGSADFTEASIDPLTLTINAAGNIVVQGGTGNSAGGSLVASSLIALNAAGNVSILGGTSPALLNATAGGVDINTPGTVLIASGLAPNGDALIIANNGAGPVVIRAAACTGCVLLGSDPFQNSTADVGAFAGSLDLILAGAVAAGGDGETNELNADEVLVLEELRERLLDDGDGDGSDSGGGDDDDERTGPRQCR